MKNIYIKSTDNSWGKKGYVVVTPTHNFYVNGKGKIQCLVQDYGTMINELRYKGVLSRISMAEAQKLVPSVNAKTLESIKLIKKIIVAKNPVRVLFPKPSIYQMTYQKVSGEQDSYEISSPIAVNDDHIIAYCFNRKGLRTFKRAGILEICEK